LPKTANDNTVIALRNGTTDDITVKVGERYVKIPAGSEVQLSVGQLKESPYNMKTTPTDSGLGCELKIEWPAGTNADLTIGLAK
jgi:hypothetical protein